MIADNVRLSYDPRYSVAYIRFREKTSQVESICISDELIIDISPDGRVYGIELLNANEQLSREAAEMLVVVNEATGEEIKVPLAPA